MNYKILLKALNFAFLPTAIISIILLVGFWNITSMLQWITSNSGGAITVRILILVAEIILILCMYDHYSDKEEVKTLLKLEEKDKVETKIVANTTDIEDCFHNRRANCQYHVSLSPEKPNLLLVERIKLVK